MEFTELSFNNSTGKDTVSFSYCLLQGIVPVNATKEIAGSSYILYKDATMCQCTMLQSYVLYSVIGPMISTTILLQQCFENPSMRRSQIKSQQESNGRKAYVQRKLANNGGSMCLIHYRASELL
jgi:hypothetical protein